MERAHEGSECRMSCTNAKASRGYMTHGISVSVWVSYLSIFWVSGRCGGTDLRGSPDVGLNSVLYSQDDNSLVLPNRPRFTISNLILAHENFDLPHE